MSKKIFIGKASENDFNIIINNIIGSQKEKLGTLDRRFNIFDSEKKKKKIKMIGLIYSTCFTALDNLDPQDITQEDIEIAKSIYNYHEINQIAYLFNRINPNPNLINNPKSQNQQNIISKENLLKLDLKKKELKSIQSIKAEEPKMVTCNICFEDYNENDIFNPELECKHHIHGECFLKYLEAELNSNHFPIKCPICLNQNKHDINYKIILDCLLLGNKDNLAVKLENKSLNYLAENNPDAVSFCPTAGCKFMCFYDKDEYHLNCPLCKKSYCLKCKTEWHKLLTCEEYQMQRKMNDENEMKFEEYVKGNKFKQCPNCKRWVEKISGCDHITCTCGREFCYHCGKLYDINGSHKCNYNYERNEEEQEINSGSYSYRGESSLSRSDYSQENYLGFNQNNNTNLFGTNLANNQINFSSNQNNNRFIFGYNQNNGNNPFGNNQSNNNNNQLFGLNQNIGAGNLFGNNQNNNINNNGSLFGLK